MLGVASLSGHAGDVKGMQMKVIRDMYGWDVFMSYATPNQDIARALATALDEHGIRVWFDQLELKPGESLIDSLNQGLRFSRIGVVIFSHDFFARDWTQAELKALYHLVKSQPQQRRVVPVWYRLSKQEVISYAPLFADTVSLSWEEGMETIVARLLDVIRPSNEYAKQLAQTLAQLRLALEHEDYQTKVGAIIAGSEIGFKEIGNFLRKIALQPLNPILTRIRAVQVLISYDIFDNDLTRVLIEDSNTDFLKSLINLLTKQDRYVLSETNAALLLQNPHLPRVSTGVGKLLENCIRSGRASFTSKIFLHASNHPHWAVKYDAVKTIIRLDDEDSISTLEKFANMSYWQARRRITSYIHYRIQQESLTSSEQAIAINMLQNMLSDGETTLTTPTARRMREALHLLGAKSPRLEKREVERQKTVVLFWMADPSDVGRLRLSREFREVQEQLERAKVSEGFELKIKTSVRTVDLTQSLLVFSPHIVHFAGHGSHDGIVLEDQNGNAHTISAQALISLLSEFSGSVECVILNACFSADYAQLLSQHIKYVVGMDTSISDDAAIAYSVGFYQALGTGVSIDKAHKMGVIQIHLLGTQDEGKPILWKSGKLIA